MIRVYTNLRMPHPIGVTQVKNRRISESDLFWAVLEADLGAVQKAIDQGDDINGLDRDGRTPLFQAVVDGNIAIASRLLKAGADVNARARDLEETPLHFAAREYRVEIADLLLKSGAHVEAQDRHGNTPLSTAVFYSRGRGEMIKLFLAHSADKSLKNKHGVSPEDLANTIGNYDVAKFLRRQAFS